MAEQIPPPLKIPEVSRFLNRANQLRTFKPAVAYWCEYHAVNQIVGKSLHTTDDDCFNFTKTLLERLESTKAERPDDDAIIDNTAGQAYVEQFAQETFDRAERAMRANKVTRQTADTFDAAATFFDLTHEWGTPEPEVLQKIKFAKWNAARILKAIREGKDPNESNPNPRGEEEEEAEVALDPSDPAVQEITGSTAPPLQVAYVEEIPDTGEPSRQEVVPTIGFPPSPPAAQEGYFPTQPAPPSEPYVPSPLSSSPAPPMTGISPPPIQPSPPAQTPLAQVPQQPTPPVPPQMRDQFTLRAAAQPSFPQASDPAENPSIPPSWTAPTQHLPPTVATPPPPASIQHPPPSAPIAAPIQNLGGSGSGGRNGPFLTDQKSLTQAQKHAKWAISALNFEDVPTAVLELRNALAALGAS